MLLAARGHLWDKKGCTLRSTVKESLFRKSGQFIRRMIGLLGVITCTHCCTLINTLVFDLSLSLSLSFMIIRIKTFIWYKVDINVNAKTVGIRLMLTLILRQWV